jgi:hypothetical protein
MSEAWPRICECGAEFTRPSEFEEWFIKFGNVFFKWKLLYCDKCFHDKTEAALKHLPDVVAELEAAANTHRDAAG